MDLIDRYLAAVGLLLPRGQRADITAELREALLSRHEEKEAELGRPLTRGEEDDLLRAFGHPIAVAGRYGRQQYLVGPELYPIYVFSLKVLVAIVAASAVITGIVNSAVGPDQPGSAISTALAVLWNGAIASVGVLTIIAAILQHQNIPQRFLTRWDPRDLPRLPRKPVVRRGTRFDEAGAAVWTVIFILWWTRVLPAGIPYVSDIPLRAGQHLMLTRAPIWDQLFWPVLALSVVAVAVHAARVVRNAPSALGHGLDMVRNLAGVAVAWVSLRAGTWVVVSGAGVSASALSAISRGVNLGFQVGLIVLLVASACGAGYCAWRLYRSRSAPA